jgi:hypothetical protein
MVNESGVDDDDIRTEVLAATKQFIVVRERVHQVAAAARIENEYLRRL